MSEQSKVDVQNQVPENEIELEKVGVEGLRKFLLVKRPNKTYQIIATINTYITLPPNLRGAHMSRFIESINEIPDEANSIEDLAKTISEKSMRKHNLNSYTEIFADLPFERVRPSGKKEMAIAKMFTKYSTKDGKTTSGVTVLGITACPCSKEMCNGLTHNQRAELTIEITLEKTPIELFDVINIALESFSSPVFSLLKRPEEKQVVEKIHQNPRFVEDVTRKCVQLLREKYPGLSCIVRCISHESIHDHNVCSEWRGKL